MYYGKKLGTQESIVFVHLRGKQPKDFHNNLPSGETLHLPYNIVISKLLYSCSSFLVRNKCCCFVRPKLSLMKVLSFICSWWFGAQCFFGAAGCDSTCGIRGTMVIFMYVCAYVGTANLLRHTEGATWASIVLVRTNDIKEDDIILLY